MPATPTRPQISLSSTVPCHLVFSRADPEAEDGHLRRLPDNPGAGLFCALQREVGAQEESDRQWWYHFFHSHKEGICPLLVIL